MDEHAGRNPLRTGIVGAFLIVCLMLVAVGYSSLPFWPQGRMYSAVFNDAAGITPGSDVAIAGIKVGKVDTVSLAEKGARINFTVRRNVAVGDQSLVAIKTDSVLGQKSLEVSPAGSGVSTSIPLARTTTPYTLNTALQDLGGNSAALDKPQLELALTTLSDSLRAAAPQLRSALDGVTALSRSINGRDQALSGLLTDANGISRTLSKRSDQVNRLITDGNLLFSSLSDRRQALHDLIGGISAVSEQLSGLVKDNETEFGPALEKLNLVVANLNSRSEHISQALQRLPTFATTLGEVVASGPGFQVNVNGLLTPPTLAVPLDLIFQPGKLPDSLSDLLKGYISERTIIRPKSP